MVEKYAELAEDYDVRWPSYIEATTRETVARMDPGPSDRVLDVGCGTGALLHRLMASYPQARLCGIDPVPEMLDVARRKLPPEIPLQPGWAERLPFEDGAFDAIVSCNMLHYVRQPAKALAEMRRVLRPGGRVTITDWCDDYLACRLYDLCLRLVNPAHAGTYGERKCARLLRQAGFREVTVERYKISWWWGLMTAAAVRPG